MPSEIQMTKLSDCAGCGAKVGAGMLSSLLSDIKTHSDERLLVGFDKSDDASVYKITEDIALVQTLDFFPPIVDDPYMFGQIAAANSISDIYAMGATPKLAMNILCISNMMDTEAIKELLRGGYEKAYEAETIITGGHTIQGKEPKYGLSVSGFIHPNKILKNSSANNGDVLILTKPLGIGITTTAHKANLSNPIIYKQAVTQMAQLNKTACNIMLKYNPSSCTDITGFGLIGHMLEMAKGGDVTIEVDYKNIPILDGVYELAQMGIIPAGMYRNREYAEAFVNCAPNVDRAMEDILYDPQTSGGLLISVPQCSAQILLKELNSSISCACVIGYVTPKKEHHIYIK